MRVLGIDPGLAIIGYGVIDCSKKKYKLVDCNSFFTSNNDDFGLRLRNIYCLIKEILEKYKPDSIAMESLFFYKNRKTFINVSQACGVILMAISEYGLEVNRYTPLQIKRNIANSGFAKKIEVKNKLKEIFSLDVLPKLDDSIDGLAIALTHIKCKNEKLFI